MFCTVRDVQVALAPVGAQGNTGTATMLPPDQIEDAIGEADATISAYLSQRYVIPMVDITVEGQQALVAAQPIRSWSRNIAAYLATLTYKRNKDVPENEPVRLRYSQTMLLLTDVRDGRATLDLPVPGQDDDGSTGAVFNLYEGTLFGPQDFYLTGRPAGSGFGIWPGGPCG